VLHSLSLYYWIVQMSFFTERSIYWRPDALIPAPIFCRIHWIWAPLKVGVSRNKCSDKRGIMYLKCLPFVEEKFLHVTCPSTALQMLAQVFMV